MRARRAYRDPHLGKASDRPGVFPARADLIIVDMPAGMEDFLRVTLPGHEKESDTLFAPVPLPGPDGGAFIILLS